MFYGRYDYPTGKFLWGNLRYQRVSEYNLQTFLNMKNRKLREEQIMSAKRDYYEVLGVSRDADKNTIKAINLLLKGVCAVWLWALLLGY